MWVCLIIIYVLGFFFISLINFRELQQNLEEMKQYETSGKAGKMKTLQNELSQSEERVRANEAKDKDLNDKMNENFQKVTSKENRERMLADNRKLQILNKEKTTNEGKVDGLENKLESLNYDSVRYFLISRKKF